MEQRRLRKSRRRVRGRPGEMGLWKLEEEVKLAKVKYGGQCST